MKIEFNITGIELAIDGEIPAEVAEAITEVAKLFTQEAQKLVESKQGK